MIEKEWCPGRKLCRTLNIDKVEIYKPVSMGLQPYTKEFFQLYPPGVAEALRDSKTLTAEIECYKTAHPGVDNLSNEDWHTLHFDREIDPSGNVLPLTLPNGVSSYQYEQYCIMKGKLDIANELISKYPHRPSWKGYELPVSSVEIKADRDLLLRSIYRTEDINQFINQSGVQENAEQEDQHTGSLTDHENAIRLVQVSYVSPDEVSIAFGAGEPSVYTREEMGFKAKRELWNLFIDLVWEADQYYEVGIYSRDKDPVKNKNYNKRLRRLGNFNKQFVSFLNEKFHVSLPGGFSAFQNQKKYGNSGKYKPKFRIVATHNATKSSSINNMSRDATIEIINELLNQLHKEKVISKRKQLQERIGPYAVHAVAKKWLTEEQLTYLAQSPDAVTDAEDALSRVDPGKTVENLPDPAM